MMNDSQQKEEFSRAYVHAVATVAGFTLYRPQVDDDSIDVGFAQRCGTDDECFSAPRLEAQLKCTCLDVVGDDAISFDLKVKNYNDLCLAKVFVPRILIVVVVPEDIEHWLHQTEEELLLRRCAWWTSLRGLARTENKQTAAVHLPRERVFSPQALRDLMQQIASGERP